MALKILKYKLDNKHRQTIELTEGAEILSVHNQNNNACIWAEVNTDNPVEKREIITYATGENLNPCEGKRFLGTVSLDQDYYVCHIYEKL